MPRKRRRADAPAGWVTCKIPNCPNYITPKSKVRICYTCRTCMAYHTKQGPVHCALYAAKIEKLDARAKIFAPRRRKRKAS